MIGLYWKIWIILVLSRPHGGCHCIVQKVKDVCVPPAMARRLRGLNMYITVWRWGIAYGSEYPCIMFFEVV